MSEPATLVKSENRSVSIICYRTVQPTARAKIMLQQLLLLFSIAGEKMVFFAGEQVSVKTHQFVMLTAGNCLMTEIAATKSND